MSRTRAICCFLPNSNFRMALLLLLLSKTIIVVVFVVFCHFGINFTVGDSNPPKCGDDGDAAEWANMLKRGQIGGTKVPDEFICELSRTEKLIKAALTKSDDEQANVGQSVEPNILNRYLMLKNGVDQMRTNDPQLASIVENIGEKTVELKDHLKDGQKMTEKRIYAINLSMSNLLDKMATKVGVNLSDVKPIKFENHSELFKAVLNVLKMNDLPKNDSITKGMLNAIFGLAKSLLEQQNNLLILKAGQRRRLKRAMEVTSVVVLIVGVLLAALIVALIGYLWLRSKAPTSSSN